MECKFNYEYIIERIFLSYFSIFILFIFMNKQLKNIYEIEKKYKNLDNSKIVEGEIFTLPSEEKNFTFKEIDVKNNNQIELQQKFSGDYIYIKQHIINENLSTFAYLPQKPKIIFKFGENKEEVTNLNMLNNLEKKLLINYRSYQYNKYNNYAYYSVNNNLKVTRLNDIFIIGHYNDIKKVIRKQILLKKIRIFGLSFFGFLFCIMLLDIGFSNIYNNSLDCQNSFFNSIRLFSFFENKRNFANFIYSNNYISYPILSLILVILLYLFSIINR